MPEEAVKGQPAALKITFQPLIDGGHMKQDVGFILIISLIITMLSGAVPVSAQLSGSSDAAPQGYWQLVEIEEEIPDDQSFEAEYASGYKRNSYQHGQLAFDWGIENYDYDETITVNGTAVASFTMPPEQIQPYDTLTFNVSLTTGHTASVPADFEDEAVAAVNFYGLIEDPSASALKISAKLTGNTQVQDIVHVTFLPSNGIVFASSIGFELYGFNDLGGPLRTYFNYEWVGETQEQPAESNDIHLRGLSLDMRGEPMPWMQLEAYVYYGQEDMDWSASPDRLIKGLTDHEGRFHLHIPAAERTADASGQTSDSHTAGTTGILLMGYLTSAFPFDEDKELFRFIDLADAESVRSENIRLATWITVNPEENSGFEPGQPINLYRLLAFYHLALNTWSVDDMSLPEPVYFFTDDPDRQAYITKLEDYSLLYTAAHQAWFFGGILLNEKDKLMRDPVRIMLNNHEWSHYEPDGNKIMLEDKDSKRDDSSIFTLMHEFGHYFDLWTNAVYNYRAAAGKAEGDANHGGYFNKSTSDSYMEGFATAYAGLVQLYSGYPGPEYMAGFVLTDPPAYLAWGTHGKEEELAIAALLYQTNQKYTDIRTFWSVISQDRLNFYEYYNALHGDLSARSGAHAAWLRDFAIASGLYKMPFGNNEYDKGEPFLDADEDGQFSPGERFADLMFDTDDAGNIDYSKPLEAYDPDDLHAGKSSPANTPDDQPRYTLYQSEDSFLNLNGEVPDYVLVRYYPNQRDAYSALFSVDDNRVYIPLGSVPVNGRVEVHIPGGNMIWQQDMAVIQRHKAQSGGAALPLGEVTVDASQLYRGDRVPAATRGQIHHDGTMERPQMHHQTLIERANGGGYTDLETLARERLSLSAAPGGEDSRENESLPPAGGIWVPDSSSGSISGFAFILAIFLLFLVIAAVILVLLLRKQSRSYTPASYTGSINQDHSADYTPPSQPILQPDPYQPATRQPYQQTLPVQRDNSLNMAETGASQNPAAAAVRYCSQCGQQLSSADVIFCRHCGHANR